MGRIGEGCRFLVVPKGSHIKGAYGRNGGGLWLHEALKPIENVRREYQKLVNCSSFHVTVEPVVEEWLWSSPCMLINWLSVVK